MAPQDRVRNISSQVVASAGIASTGLNATVEQGNAGGRAGRRTWDHKWEEKPTPGTVAMVGAPLCEGQTLGGVNLAPDAFRDSGLQKVIDSLNWGFEDHGDVPRAVEVAKHATPVRKAEATYYPTEDVKNSDVVGAGVGAVMERVYQASANGNFVLTVGGDHSVAAGSITGILKRRPDTAVVWIDAHGDCNTPDTSPSGNYHGMPLAHVMGWFDKRVEGFEWCDDHLEQHGPLPEDRVALIALRDVDAEERELLRNSHVHVFCMQDIDRHGIGAVMEMALQRVDPKNRRPLHLSFDIDSCDPVIAPGTGTKARGGLSYREAHYICERLAMTRRLGSMDIVEVNPALDEPVKETMHGDDLEIKGTETVRLGIELVASALGKTIV